MTDLNVLVGNGDLVSFLEELAQMAREGRLECVAVATLEDNGNMGAGLAYHPELEHAFARTLGAVANLQHLIVTSELSFEELT